MHTAVSGLPHTRARPFHWLATAVALGATVGLAGMFQTSGATASSVGSAAAPDPEVTEYPMDCGPHGVAVTHQAEVDLDGDGRPETVAAVRCDAGGGSPPSAVYLLSGAGAAGNPIVAEVLVDPADGMVVEKFELSGRSLTARLLGYSGPEVPRNAPDLQGEATWSWSDGELVVDYAASRTATAV